MLQRSQEGFVWRGQCLRGLSLHGSMCRDFAFRVGGYEVIQHGSRGVAFRAEMGIKGFGQPSDNHGSVKRLEYGPLEDF